MRPAIARVVLAGASSEGSASEPDPPSDSSAADTWSVMHLMAPGTPALPGTDSGITEGDSAMMVGAYAGVDYS